MTKQDIINHVSQEAHLSRAKAEEAADLCPTAAITVEG